MTNEIAKNLHRDVVIGVGGVRPCDASPTFQGAQQA